MAWAFEHYFGLEGWEFEQTKLQKLKCAGGPWEDAEASNWLTHKYAYLGDSQLFFILCLHDSYLHLCFQIL